MSEVDNEYLASYNNQCWYSWDLSRWSETIIWIWLLRQTAYIRKKELRELNALNGMNTINQIYYCNCSSHFLNVTCQRIVNWINNISNAPRDPRFSLVIIYCLTYVRLNNLS